MVVSPHPTHPQDQNYEINIRMDGRTLGFNRLVELVLFLRCWGGQTSYFGRAYYSI